MVRNVRRSSRRSVKYNEGDNTITQVHNPRTNISLEQSYTYSPEQKVAKIKIETDRDDVQFINQSQAHHTYYKYNSEAKNHESFRETLNNVEDNSEVFLNYRSSNTKKKAPNKTPTKSPFLRKSSFSSKVKSRMNKSVDRRYGRAGEVVEFEKERRAELEPVRSKPSRFISRGGFSANKSKYINDGLCFADLDTQSHLNNLDLDTDDDNPFDLKSESESKTIMQEYNEEPQSTSRYIRKSGYGKTTLMRDY